MQDSVIIKAPAKINLFLRITGQKENGYHNIRTGITFLDLHDELKISFSKKNNLFYSGFFKPTSKEFKNDIIVKVLEKISLNKKTKLKIEIKKNIPSKAGLGSASTNAASLIKGFQKLKLINKIDNNILSQIGADVPACFYGKNCLATGIGNDVNTNISFPKYYFILVKPKIELSTIEMYKKIKDNIALNKSYIEQTADLKIIHKDDNGNDFEIIAKKENQEIYELLNFLSLLNENIFSRMTGSGSCCYAVFNNKNSAKKALEITSNKFKKYWVYLAENNINNK